MTHSDEHDRGEQEFLANYDAGEFPRPSVAVDVAIVTAQDGELRALVTQRADHPAKGRWCLPGGFVGLDESLDDAAARVLRDKAGIGDVYLEQLYTFGAPSRDPRTRVITVAYYALVHPAKLAELAPVNGTVKLATLEVAWEGETGGPATIRDGDTPLPLAFDHADILGWVVLRLRGKLDYANIGFELLPEQFTLRQLQEVHETILGRPLNKDSFRRRILASGRVVATGRRESDVGHRPAALYRFTQTGGM
ncbi:MAG: NUDIX hydrolase [Planctomycetota bacterium]|jgi:8-oxo-dGTP diphosphatase